MRSPCSRRAALGCPRQSGRARHPLAPAAALEVVQRTPYDVFFVETSLWTDDIIELNRDALAEFAGAASSLALW